MWKNNALVIVTLAVLTLAGCANPPATCVSDANFPGFHENLYPVIPEYELSTVTITWHRLTEAQLMRINRLNYARGGGRDGSLIAAFAIPDPKHNRCDVYIRSPKRDGEDTRLFGHEILHCFDGYWHPQKGKVNGAQIAALRKLVNDTLASR